MALGSPSQTSSLRTLLILAVLLVLCSTASAAAAHRSPGCDPSAPKPVEWDPKAGEIKLFRVNERNVRVTVPPNFDAAKPAAMVVAYHDQDSSAEVLDYETGFGEEGVNGDVVVVYPAAHEGRWSSELRPPKIDASSSPKPENYTSDVDFTKLLLHDLSRLLCLDTTRIYATGLGSGGGMMHLLACDDELSTQFAAFAAVGAGFGRAPRGKKTEQQDNVWATCTPGRKPVPVLEIHGTDDGIFGYYLREGENGRLRTIPKDWVEEWAERNECGETSESDAVQSSSDPATFVTKLEGGGWLTETVEHGGAVVRVARQCKASATAAAPKGALRTKDATVLHYQIKGYGHGWPRQQLRGSNEVMFKDTLVTLATDDMSFDTSRVVLDFFKAHRLPTKYAKLHSQPAAPPPRGQQVPKMQMPSAQDFEAKLREVNEASRNEYGSRGRPKWSEDEIQAQLQQFRDAQLKPAEGYREQVVDEDADGGGDAGGRRVRDEL